ncbi:MAG: ADP-forming succinate--CoA ligase subunit beta [bacterium]
MKLQEYQGKELFRAAGLPVPAGEVATTVDEAVAIANKLGYPVVVKAQVLVGGRGKAGGVKLAHSEAEAREKATAILGMDIKGLKVEKILITTALDIKSEYYAAITLDRDKRRDVVMVSAAGGMDIEEVAATTPEKIVKYWIDPAVGFPSYAARDLAFRAGFDPAVAVKAAKMLVQLYQAYIKYDASLCEINPLLVTPTDEAWAADCKFIIDDNALFRQKVTAEGETDATDPIEKLAQSRHLNYVRLEDGNIGIIGNGAGLVMSTMDAVRDAGGRPADFLDIGGGAKAEAVALSLDTVLQDSNVKGVLINVFGGITRCDEVAKGILEGIARCNPKVPLVVRLEGTASAEGLAILADSGLPFAKGLREAAELIVQKSL